MQLEVTQKRAMSHFGTIRRLEHRMKLRLKEMEDDQLSVGWTVARANMIRTAVFKDTLVTFAHRVPTGGMEKEA
jgi:hypothetical protein